jgi:hypothetical protein
LSFRCCAAVAEWNTRKYTAYTYDRKLMDG